VEITRHHDGAGSKRWHSNPDTHVFSGGHKRETESRGLGARCATASVHKLLHCEWDVVVHHLFHARDVQTPCSNIRRLRPPPASIANQRDKTQSRTQRGRHRTTMTQWLSALNLSRFFNRCRCCICACNPMVGSPSSVNSVVTFFSVWMAFTNTNVRPGWFSRK
jgi:hypothetical protein